MLSDVVMEWGINQCAQPLRGAVDLGNEPHRACGCWKVDFVDRVAKARELIEIRPVLRSRDSATQAGTGASAIAGLS